MQEIIDKDVTLENCVTSNCQTKSVSSLKEHPIRKFYDMGVKTTINSDNMTVSHTNIDREIEKLKNVLGFTDSDILKMEQNAMESAFLR